MSKHNLLLLGTAQLLTCLLSLLLTISACYTFMSHLRNPNQCPVNPVNCLPTVFIIIVPLSSVDLLLQIVAGCFTIWVSKNNTKCIVISSISISIMSAICCAVAGFIFKGIAFKIFSFLAISEFIAGLINILAIIFTIRISSSCYSCSCCCEDSPDSGDCQADRRPSFFKDNLVTNLFKSSQDRRVTKYSEIL